MGGPGSGRPLKPDCKETTEEYDAIDIRAVKRHGLIERVAKLLEELPGDIEGAETVLEARPPRDQAQGYAPHHICPACGAVYQSQSRGRGSRKREPGPPLGPDAERAGPLGPGARGPRPPQGGVAKALPASLVARQSGPRREGKPSRGAAAKGPGLE